MLISIGNTSVEAFIEHPLAIRMTDTQTDMAPCCEARSKFWMFTTDIQDSNVSFRYLLLTDTAPCIKCVAILKFYEKNLASFGY